MHKLDEIYKENYQLVYKYLLCLTQNPDIAEELTQETFYKMLKKINTFIGDYYSIYYQKNKAYCFNDSSLTYSIINLSDDYIPGISLFNLEQLSMGQAFEKSSTQSAFEYVLKNKFKIKKDFLENKEYIVISTEDKDTFIDPNTFLVTQTNFLGTIQSQIIEKNVVTDSDITLPDLNTYTYESDENISEN